MSGLSWVGATPADPIDIETKLDSENIFSAGMSRGYVNGRVATKVAQRGSKSYVDTQDSTFATNTYYVAQDALLVPNGAKGVASGVASLDSSSKVPIAQVPIIGAGILKGPWGHTTAFGGSTQATPFKIAEWTLGVAGVTGQPLVFFTTSMISDGGKPVIEIRMGTSTQTTYAAQTLIASGFGKTYYKDYQVITCLPVDPDLSESQDGLQDQWASSANLLVNAWMYDAVSTHTVTTTNTSIASAALFFARTAL